MKTAMILALALQLSAVALAQTVSPSAAPAPQIAEVRSGELHLKGYFWKPGGPGPFPAILFNHGSGAGRAAAYGGSDDGRSRLRPGSCLSETRLRSFIFAGGARVFPPTKAPLLKTF